MKSFQDILLDLSLFWKKQGCIIHQGYDLEVGAGTFNPATFLRCLGPEPYRAAYVEPSRRPSDGRFGENPIRFQHYFQYQVILKPSPPNILDLYLQSLLAIGFDLSKHDIRFVHDDWEQPTIGAWGLGWEVWMDGMEVTQFTYFQSVGGVDLKPITGEITYGIERLSTFLQGVDSTFELEWSGDMTYGDIYKRNEFEWSHYNFDEADTGMWHRHFEDFEKEAKRLIGKRLPLPAYDFVMKSSHAFNMLDARGAISVSERSSYIGRIRELARLVAELYIASREEQNFPLLHKFKGIAEEPKSTEKSPPFVNPSRETEDFLLEIGLEELPATFVLIGVQGLEKAIRNFLTSQKIPFKEIFSYGTPRRLAVLVEGLALSKPPQETEKRGPAAKAAFDPEGNPLPPAIGFFRSLNQNPLSLTEIREGNSSVEIRSIKGTDYLFATVKSPQESTAHLLQENLPALILGIDFPKKMRWGNEEIQFARPLRWIACLIGDQILPFSIGAISSGNHSQGHRQLKNGTFPISSPGRYLESLRTHYVIADIAERQTSIILQLNALEKTMGGKALLREKVISQVLHLSEWPVLTFASFDPAYLKAPKEILISEMVEHQKYFPVEEEGNLKNLFVITADNNPSELIKKGNQTVLSSRLKDGTFLYEQDLKVSLEAFREKLKKATFLTGLGSLFDKTERLKLHGKTLLKYLPIADISKVEKGAELSKCDLASGVVYEFPELQGVMGKIYALQAGIDPDIAASIDEHWMPRGENAPLPKTPTGMILSLADKIDNLLSCFGMGMKPTSSSDPFALRRQVLGIIRIVIQGQYRLPLRQVIEECLAHFSHLSLKNQELIEEISGFILNRIRTVFLEDSLKKDEIEASLSSGFNDIYDTFCRITALRNFRQQGQAFPALFEVYKRAKGQIPNGNPLPFEKELLKEPAEQELAKTLDEVEKDVSQAIQLHDYKKAYEHLALLQPSLNQLFEEVKILADDQRLQQNRLALLQKVFGLFNRLVDFSKIQGN
jgi:glycyl-tRNA synthetase